MRDLPRQPVLFAHHDLDLPVKPSFWKRLPRLLAVPWISSMSSSERIKQAFTEAWCMSSAH